LVALPGRTEGLSDAVGEDDRFMAGTLNVK